MSQEIKTVMVLGATGNLGPHILSGLLAADFTVTVLSRSQRSTTSAIPVEVKILQTDYTFTSLVEAFKGQDAVISAVPTFTAQQQVTIIDAAVAAKVKRFIPSEFGSDTSVDDDENAVEFLKEKQEIVRYLRTKEAEGLSWTSLCTGIWVDWMLEEGSGLLGLDVRSKTATIIDSGNQELTASTMPLIAKATASVLLHPEETKNRYVQVHSFTMTQNSLLQALERATGSEFSRKTMARGEMRAIATKHLEEGDYEHGYYELVNSLIFSGSPFVLFPERAARGNQLLGLVEAEGLDGMVKRVLGGIEKP